MPTVKQINRGRFFIALHEYRRCLRRHAKGTAFVHASLAVHAALSAYGVPKSYRRMVTRAFKTGGKE